jgi:phage portal protein BeeE
MLGALVRNRGGVDDPRRGLSINDYAKLWERFAFNGISYAVPGGNLPELTALSGADNPIVWACISTRLMVFADAPFAFQDNDGQIDRYNRRLSLLRNPWPGGTQRDVLARMEVDASLYGNSYWVRYENGLQRLEPSKVKTLTGSMKSDTGRDFGKTLLGYVVLGDNQNDEIMQFEPDEVAHYRPIPDPRSPYRGAAWINSVMPDVMSDDELTHYKQAYLRNAGTSSMVVTFDPTVDEDSFKRVVETIEHGHTGSANAWRTLYLGGGADVKTVGANFDQLDMKAVQGAGETRIAAAAGVPAVLGRPVRVDAGCQLDDRQLQLGEASIC